MFDTDQWLNEMRTDLARLDAIDLGYPKGENTIFEKPSTLPLLPNFLDVIYSAFDGLSFPDIWNGIFVDRAAQLATAADRNLPIVLRREHGSIPICPFGSDGSGGAFVVGLDDGAVYYLPVGGIFDGVYKESPNVPVKKLAPSVDLFLLRIQGDLRAFIDDDESHIYWDAT